MTTLRLGLPLPPPGLSSVDSLDCCTVTGAGDVLGLDCGLAATRLGACAGLRFTTKQYGISNFYNKSVKIVAL